MDEIEKPPQKKEKNKKTKYKKHTKKSLENQIRMIRSVGQASNSGVGLRFVAHRRDRSLNGRKP
ncbi:hypothetical protein HYC85_020767 [Camellia sinensis]|uniref:Uncharacterized protein n=1 Tax=Camellia sinensis TaxID=4442 RepID=A0A7J7GSH3_CAMSI|nr:hypothetical protein HYC85_020767 [Camellia sinensis]